MCYSLWCLLVSPYYYTTLYNSYLLFCHSWVILDCYLKSILNFATSNFNLKQIQKVLCLFLFSVFLLLSFTVNIFFKYMLFILLVFMSLFYLHQMRGPSTMPCHDHIKDIFFCTPQRGMTIIDFYRNFWNPITT